ncbi:MAG TPA: MerR family transcriptional regulator [Spirochaetes bacterium]|nr:MerR family transcriptional regulator [Spirochaetota bacterium]
MKPANYYKISELSRISSTSIPAIRFYLREGLLPPAIKTGKTTAYYTDDHLNRLRMIKKLQTEQQRTLASIKMELDVIPAMPAPDDCTVIASSEKRNEIVSAATQLFLNKGLGETSIDDIVNRAGIGKGTFYKYFKDKDDVFIQCADSIFHEMYSHVWQEIKNEPDRYKRLVRRTEAFFESYPQWIDMMNLVRHASVGGNPVFKGKFIAVLNQIIKPISRDLEALQHEGRIPLGIDCLQAAYLLMGMAEYGAWLIYNTGTGAVEILRVLLELVNAGIGRTK